MLQQSTIRGEANRHTGQTIGGVNECSRWATKLSELATKLSELATDVSRTVRVSTQSSAQKRDNTGGWESEYSTRCSDAAVHQRRGAEEDSARSREQRRREANE